MNSDKLASIISSLLAIFCTIPTAISIAKGEIMYAIIFGSIVVFFVVILIVKYSIKTNCTFIRKVKFYYRKSGTYFLRKREIYYEYLDSTHMNHWKKFTACALSDGFDTLPDRYVFSGSAICKIHAMYPDQSIIEEYKDLGVNFYSIKATTPCRKKENREFGMRMDTIEDPNCEAKPFLSTGIYEATEHLKMTVKFGSSVNPINAKLLIFKNYIDRVPVSTTELRFDTNTRTLSYEEEYPVYGYKYLLSWTF